MVCTSLVLAAVLAAALVALAAYITHRQGHWRRRGVFTAPHMFLLGNFGEIFLRKKAFPDVVKDIYTSIKSNGQKFGGMYQLTKPILVITDPELMRDITIKYFDSFTDRRGVPSEKVDILFSRSLLSLKGDRWREMRHLLSPAFTGSKLRAMADLMGLTSRTLTRFLVERADPEQPIEIRDVLRRFAADVIASTAYGTVSDSVNHEDAPFYKYGDQLMDPRGLRGLVLAGFILSAKMMEFFNFKFTPKKITEFFINTIEKNIEYREKENKTRPDMIQLLMDARKNKSKMAAREAEEGSEKTQGEPSTPEITNVDIVAQAFTFFLGGFETVSTVLSFAALELAANPEVQDRLRAELDAAIGRAKNQLTLEVVGDLKYMDQVVSEVLRKYPPVVMADRVCSRAISLPEYGLVVEADTDVGLPFHALHHDPEFFPEPERFDPERFSEENKHKIKPFTYLPFGAGPRNCIGMRFALLEVKLCLAHVLATCDLHVCARTQLPIKMSAKSPQLLVEGGFWLTVRPRDFPSLVPTPEEEDPEQLP